MFLRKSFFLLFAYSIFLIVCSSSCQRTKNVKINTVQELSVKIIKDSLNSFLYYERGLIFYNEKKYEFAIYDLRKACYLDSVFSYIQNIKYNLYLGLSLYEHFKNSITNNIKDYNLLNKSLLCFEKVLLTSDTSYFKDKRIIEEYNSYKEIQHVALINRCEIYILLSDYENALNDVNYIQQIKPKDFYAYYLGGFILNKLNRIDEAVNQYHRSISINSKQLNSYLQLGSIYQNRNDSICVTYYNNVLSLDSNNINALYNIAKYYQDNLMFDNSIKFYNKILRVDKFDESTNYNLGYIYFYLADYIKAANYFSDAIYSNPDNYLAYRNRSWCFKELGRVEEANRDSLKWMQLKNE